MFSGEDSQEHNHIQSIRLNRTVGLSFPGSSPTYTEQNNDNGIIFSTQNYVERNQSRLQPPAFFTGYTLPPGNPCETFRLPPPPADKKRTGPRRKFGFSSQKCFAASINCNLSPFFSICYLLPEFTHMHNNDKKEEDIVMTKLLVDPGL